MCSLIVATTAARNYDPVSRMTSSLMSLTRRPRTTRRKVSSIVREFHYIAKDDEYECPAGERLIYRFTRTESGKEIRRYWSSACPACPIHAQCTTGKNRRVSRWVHEEVVERAAARLAAKPDAMHIRRATVEHPYGTLKGWMGSTHFLTKTLDHVSTEMSLHVLAYNMKRVINLIGTKRLLEAI